MARRIRGSFPLLGLLATTPLGCAGSGDDVADARTALAATSSGSSSSSSEGDVPAGSSSGGSHGTSTSAVADSTSAATSTGSSTAASTGADATSDDGTTGAPIDWDCDALVTPFVGETELAQPRGYHDLAFDADGHIIGYDLSSLLRVTYDGDLSVFVPGVDFEIQQMDWLANGDLLVIDVGGEIHRITPDGQVSLVATGLYFGAYGLTVGPDQKVYATAGAVYRVDPDDGDVSEWVDVGVEARSLVFNLDSTGVFISTLDVGDVYFVPVDANLDPSGAVELFASGVGQGYHDGLGIDACGNLYVPDYYTSGLYRVDPEGVVTTLYAGSLEHYGHGLEWGSGIGGWNDHAIYLPQPYNGFTVNEIVLGVPSGARVRTWAGGS